MKKLMIAASAALCAAVGFSAVESSNIVGYNTVTLQPGYNMLSVSFKNVENNVEGIAVDDVFPGGGVASSLQAGAGAATADSIMVYTNDGNGGGDYTTYYLFKATKGTNPKDYWWVDSSGNLSGLKFKNGDSFWFYRRGSTSVAATVSGEVELSATTNVTLRTGYNMIGNYFPTGLVLNDSIYTAAFWENSGAAAGAGAASADSILVYTNDGAGSGDYTTYYLFKATKGTSDKNYNWVNSSGTVVNTAVSNPGQGVWYYHRGTGMTLPLHMPAGN